MLAARPSRPLRSIVLRGLPRPGSSDQHPAPNGFVGNVEPALGEEILDVSVAEREAQVKPDHMLDDDRRKPVTTV